jgi:uncharacterized membrane protein YeaQ/YmgE (transglycosylase-associated protein family)
MVLAPGGILAWLLVGLIAGVIASLLVGGSLGLIGDLVVGILGAVIGGFLAGLLGFGGVAGFWGSVLVATFGAVVLLVLLHALTPTRVVEVD